MKIPFLRRTPRPATALPDVVPQHIAIIMDGNGRWARRRGLPRLAGHRAGTENLRRIIRSCVEFGVRILTIYAFSTENWDRPPEEVSGLMAIIEDVIDRELGELHGNGVRLRHLGRLDGLNPAIRSKVEHAIELTRGNSRLILNVAFNYGGRDEMIRAIRQMIRDGLPPESIDESAVGRYLSTAGLPDPDLVIRTSGELRTSNFLLWQTAYAEWYFPPILWPDFGPEELRKAIWEYSRRERRFGRLGGDGR